MPHDVAYAVRQLRKAPAFTTAAILTLALGIGANTAIYQVLDALLFRPLPVHEPDRLVSVHLLEAGKPRQFSYREYRNLAARQQAATGMLAISDYPLHAAILRGRGQARTMNAVIVTAEYFRVLGVAAPVGRVFDEPDDRAPVAVISDAFWAREFGRSRDALGQTLQINKSVVTVIGVAPPEFSGETPGNAPDAWLPMGLTPQLLASDWLNAPKSWLTVMARLRPGMAPDQARQALESAWREVGNPGYRVALERGAHGIGGLRAQFERPVAILMAAVGVLLLIACSNLATLLVGRAMARGHEIAVRFALGAGRGRVARQLLAESLVLAAIGGALGLAVAQWASRALAAEAAPMARLPVEWNWRALAFTAGVTIAATILAGMAPALSATRPGDRHPRRFGRALVAIQVALSLVLLSGAGLLARSLWNLRHQDFGFRADHLVAADLPWEFSPAMMARYAALERPLLERLSALPEVQSAALSGFGPLGDAQHTGPLSAAGGFSVPSRIVHVSPRYFETTGVPIVRGRGITEDDRATAPRVAVLSEMAARALFGTASPVGHFVSQLDVYDDQRAIEVVGVARDVRFAGPAEPFRAIVYVSYRQFPAPITAALVRAAGDPARAAANLRAAIHSVDPDLAVAAVRAVPEIIDSQLGRERVLAALAVGFGILALALTSVGIYGLVAYAVERRAREIGIRMALGARRAQITTMLAREMALVIAASAVLGIAGAAAASRALGAVLFGIAPNDWPMLVWPALVLVVSGATAAYLPARRAARRDPIDALRQE